MPVHRTTFAALEDQVATIEQAGERIISVLGTPTEDAVVIITEPGKRVAPKGLEKR